MLYGQAIGAEDQHGLNTVPLDQVSHDLGKAGHQWAPGQGKNAPERMNRPQLSQEKNVDSFSGDA